MICSACGQEMSDDSKFCPYCGAAAVGASDAVAAKDGEAKAPDASENLRIDADGTIHMGNRPQMPTGPAAREPERPAVFLYHIALSIILRAVCNAVRPTVICDVIRRL